MTHVDTAEMYGSGRVETLVGEALAGRRERVFLVSKVLPRNATYEGTLRACEASLQRLRTDHLDCYLLHWREELPLEPTFQAFAKLQQDGKIRAWGVSNFDDHDLEDAAKIAMPACNQVLYHLGDRTIEHRVIPWCEARGVAVVAYSPFGSAGGFPKRGLDGLGGTPRQVALAFLARNAFTIPKSADPKHVEELAHEVTLDEAAVREIDKRFPLGRWNGLPML